MTPVAESGLDEALIRIDPADSVAVALRAVACGESLGTGLVATADVPAGHKIALVAHAPGDSVCKYGQAIGRATAPIAPGDPVHSHNLATALSGELAYDEAGAAHAPFPASPAKSRWTGYLREDGRAATRNEIWVIPTVGCVAMLAESVARDADIRHKGRIDAVVGFAHPHGCSQLGDDLAGTRAILAGLCDNPNAAGVLLLGLGCESNQLDALLAAVPERSRAKIRTLRAQDAEDEIDAAARMIDAMVAEYGDRCRVALPASALAVGLKCGGSDAFSGLTANPLLGRLSDWLSAAGGRLILTEIPEIFGAETALLNRSVSRNVFDRATGLLNRFKRYFLDLGLPVSENPSPGNIAGGITTLEEKSLGAVQKAGHAPLVDVIDYGMQASQPGLTLLEAPGNDAVSSTALAAAGATMILFTTGRGTPLGFPVPTIKVASNTDLATRKNHWIDFDASRVLREPADAVDADFHTELLRIASGQATAAERSGQRAIAIWKRGATL
ncbi:UxaA family hydrolase [Sphingosinithalassobacter portus]|uniref:UxaA family hydrolase n=1 Tax=Stakelama portus TaxID=2676234 RepID=UPI000D6E9451|nr:altronate dehydratase family protein [Sphingosinithalassobacter portus]